MKVEEYMSWFGQFNGVFLGWFLGLLGTPAVMYLSSIVDRRRFEAAVRTEIVELGARLAGLIFLVRSSAGTLERAHVEELLADFKSQESDQIPVNLKRLSLLSDDDFRAAICQLQDPRRSKVIPNMSAPYLAANLNLVSLLSASKQKNLINLLHHLDALNSKSQDLATWVLKTHEVLTPSAYDLVQQNVLLSTNAIVSSAEMALVRIRSFLKQHGWFQRVIEWCLLKLRLL